MQTNFVVSGEFVTTMARGFVLDKNFDRAVEFLSGSVADFPIDFAIKVLQGKAKLTGKNDLFYEEAEDLDFQKELGCLLAGTYKADGRFYRPYAYVSNLGKKDIERIIHPRVPLEKDADDWKADYAYRAWHYVDNLNSDLAIPFEQPVGKIDVVLFRQIEVPFWLRDQRFIVQDARQATIDYLAAHCFLEERGHKQRYGNTEPSPGLIKTTRQETTQPQVEFDVDITICRDYTLDFGWLSPDGIFYACTYGGHSCLADDLCKKFYPDTKCDGNYEVLLERRNWIKLLKTLSEEDSFFYYARDMEGRVTSKQRKAILRWCEKNNKKLPGFLREFS